MWWWVRDAFGCWDLLPSLFTYVVESVNNLWWLLHHGCFVFCVCVDVDVFDVSVPSIFSQLLKLVRSSSTGAGGLDWRVRRSVQVPCTDRMGVASGF